MATFAELAYAARTLRKSPLFLITAVVTIALGIGAAAAIFSVTHAVLLQPLPYRNPERLVLACEDMRQRNVRDIPMSTPDFMDLRNGTRGAFEDLTAVYTDRGVLERDDGTSEQIHFGAVTPNFFHLLGARMAAGRAFNDADGQPSAQQPEAGTTSDQKICAGSSRMRQGSAATIKAETGNSSITDISPNMRPAPISIGCAWMTASK